MEKDPRITAPVGEASSVGPGEIHQEERDEALWKSTMLGIWEKQNGLKGHHVVQLRSYSISFSFPYNKIL